MCTSRSPTLSWAECRLKKPRRRSQNAHAFSRRGLSEAIAEASSTPSNAALTGLQDKESTVTPQTPPSSQPSFGAEWCPLTKVLDIQIVSASPQDEWVLRVSGSTEGDANDHGSHNDDSCAETSDLRKAQACNSQRTSTAAVLCLTLRSIFTCRDVRSGSNASLGLDFRFNPVEVLGRLPDVLSLFRRAVRRHADEGLRSHTSLHDLHAGNLWLLSQRVSELAEKVGVRKVHGASGIHPTTQPHDNVVGKRSRLQATPALSTRAFGEVTEGPRHRTAAELPKGFQ
eukprot:scaffold2835_cov259-Pinguiococcus_pyrenoidosus.AAC.5